jgi:tetratricopeptide (TPR) repeat protein
LPTVWLVHALLARLSGGGIQATEIEPDVVHVLVPVDDLEIEGELDVVVETTDGETSVTLVVPVLDLSFVRLESALPDEASSPVSWYVDTDGEQLHLVAVHPASATDADVVVDTLLPRVLAALHELLDAGILDVTDATEDELVADVLETIVEVKQSDPRAAISRLATAATHCRLLGNPSLAAFLDMAAAEVLIDLGEIRDAAELAEPAWVQMDGPTDQRDLVTIMAHLRARQGRLDDAVALLEEALAATESDFDAAMLRGDLGVLFAQSGRLADASRLLHAAATDPDVDDHHRVHFGRQLEVLRSAGGQPLEAPATGVDATDAAIARLNELTSLLGEGDRRALEVHRARIDELIEMVAADADRLGPSQTVRLALARGQLAALDGDHRFARSELDEARAIAEASGDADLARWASNAARSVLEPLGSTPAADSTPFERVVLLANRALAELASLPQLPPGRATVAPALTTAFARGQTTARQAIGIVDAERHRYVTVADRAAWTKQAWRVYELGLISSIGAQDHAETIEVLERARAQGAPAAWAKAEGDGEPGGTGASRDVRSPRLLGLLRESLGDRPVARPLVASLKSGDAPTADVTRVDLDDVISRITGGRPAWWWACHAFGERLWWAVRSPEGATWTGGNALPGGLDAWSGIAHAFRSVETEEDLTSHPLLGDAERRRSTLLADLAATVLPEPIAEAARSAARNGCPIRVVFAAPGELARLPINMLPLGNDTMLLDGAILVLAPPTSLAVGADGPGNPSFTPRPVLLVLGAEHDLGMLRGLAAEIAPIPASVLGAPRHVRESIAGSLATPQDVRHALRANPDAVAVYYGHVVDNGPLSHSTALSLTDGERPTLLDAASLLVPERHGSTDIVVLAGCSSLSAEHVGTGEWWGLATALLWQGSNHVIGSMWDLLAGEDTEAFVAALATALRTSDDPAVTLRDVQRHHRDAWLHTGTPSPYDWGGWTIVSAGSGVSE